MALRHIPCCNKLLLTGTPLQNNLHELWALLSYLYPNLFPDSTPFDAGFVRRTDSHSASAWRMLSHATGMLTLVDVHHLCAQDLNNNHVDNNVLLSAQALLGPLMIRRLKKNVASKLPPKTETQILTRLAPFQTFFYQQLLASHAGLLGQLQGDAKKEDAAVLQEHENADLEQGDALVLEQKAELDADGNILQSQLAKLPEQGTVGGEGAAANAGGGKRNGSKEDNELAADMGGSMELTSAGGSGDWRKLLNLLMQLRKCCNHPFLFPHVEPDDAPRDAIITHSGKMQLLDKLLVKLYKGKHRVLIFSSFTGMLTIMERLCELSVHK